MSRVLCKKINFLENKYKTGYNNLGKRKMKRAFILTFILILVVALFSGCDYAVNPVEPHSNLTERIQTNSIITNNDDSGINNPVFQELVSALREAGFEWYNYYDELAEQDIIYNVNPEMKIMKNTVIAKYNEQGRVVNVQGITINQDLIEFKTITKDSKSHRMSEIIIYENNKKIFGITYHQFRKSGEVHSLIRYFPDESYNILMKIKDINPTIEFNENKEYELYMEFYGNIVFQVVTPQTINRDFALEVKSKIRSANKPPVPIAGLNAILLEPFINEKLIELNSFFDNLNSTRGGLSDYGLKWSDENVYIALDILGTGVSDFFGVLVTGVYGAASYLCCTIGKEIEEP